VIRNVRGYAYSGGGSAVVRVDVTADNGKTWITANLEPLATDTTERRTFGWRRWMLDLPVPRDSKEVQIRVRAVDDNYNTQPENAEAIWNMRGVLNNSWHSIECETFEEVPKKALRKKSESQQQQQQQQQQ